MLKLKTGCLVFVLCCCSVFAQQTFEALNSNPDYVSIKNKITVLTAQSDSVKHILNKLKDSVERHPEMRGELLQPILDMESKLFDINSSAATLASRKNMIEQEYLLANLSAQQDHNGRDSESKYLLSGRFVAAEITPAEREILKSAPEIDRLFRSGTDSLKAYHSQVSQINDSLSQPGLDRLRADSLIGIANFVSDAAVSLQASFADKWRTLLDTKQYLYSRLLQKLNVPESDILKLGNELRDARAALSEAMDNRFAPVFSNYAKERDAIMRYEKLLGEKLAYRGALDSLNTQFTAGKNMRFDLPGIQLPQYTYVAYAPVTILPVADKETPIGRVEVPTMGDIFKIQLTTLQNPVSATHSIRRIAPLSYMKNAKGGYEYFAGTYRTKEEAEADLKKLSAFGYRPVVATFRDGGKVTKEGIYPIDADEYLYSLEFPFMNDSLEARIKELAPAKELTRTGDTYTLGVFDTYGEVSALKAKITDNAKIVKIKIE